MNTPKPVVLHVQFDQIAEQIRIEPGLIKQVESRRDVEFTIESQYLKEDAQLVSVWMKTERPIQIDYLQMSLSILDYDYYFYNGFQSWSESRLYHANETYKPLNFLAKRFKLHLYGNDSFVPQDCAYSSHYTYLTNQKPYERIALLASMDESLGYTFFAPVFEKNLCRVYKEVEGKTFLPGSHRLYKLLLMKDHENKAFDYYASFIPSMKGIQKPLRGWTSWYQFYTGIDEKIITSHSQQLNQMNLMSQKRTLVQIDDGYQQHLGDWLDLKEGFPSGLKPLAAQIHEDGHDAGIWLAPFICDSDSSIYKNHPEWLVQDEKGKPKVGGWNPQWQGDFYVLNLLKEEVKDYLNHSIKTLIDMGYDYFKCDFLYALALYPHSGKSRAELMTEGVRFLRESFENVKWSACGAPLGSVMGKADYCRISADASPYYEDTKLKVLNYRERISTYNALKTMIARRHLNRRFFISDPDVYMLGAYSHLNQREKYTQMAIGKWFGDVTMTSDTFEEYSDKTLKMVDKMTELPAIKSLFTCEDDDLFIHFGMTDHKLMLMVNNLNSSSRTVSTKLLCKLTNEVLRLLKNEVESNMVYVDDRTSVIGVFDEIETRLNQIKRLKSHETKWYEIFILS